jgi:glucans biosynthesis protein
MSKLPAFLLMTLLWPGFAAIAGTPDFLDTVARRAQEVAAAPYKRADAMPEASRIGYDAYRAIRMRPEAVLWKDGAGLFRVEFFPTGFLYERPVRINVLPGIEPDGAAQAIEPFPQMFDFDKTEPPKAVALAGFKVTYPLHGKGKRDEILSFLGASYFRPIGRAQVYGASARGLAIETAGPKPEEFPEFREFWLVEPRESDRAMTLYALLDSPSATGAYRFVVRPGARTVVEIEVRLFPRNPVGVLGVAPLTSMLLTGKAGPARDDFRPEIHDSDGLQLLTSQGERIWRPLVNPGALAVSSFADNNPRGFGLMQRERRFERYQDAPASYDQRPSLWVEPEGDWGEGDVRLVEIPTPSETHDNIVAFWVPKWSAAPAETKDKPMQWRYRVSALSDEESLVGLAARVVALRHGPVEGSKARRLVVEFAGGELETLDRRSGFDADPLVESNVEVNGGKMGRVLVDRVPGTSNRRLFIDVETEGKRAADIRATLTIQGVAISETLSYVLRP